MIYECGGTEVFLYPTRNAGTSQASQAYWQVDRAEEVIAFAHEWDRAMVRNDAELIGQYMAEDWTIIGSDGRISDKLAFLRLVESGTLSHDVMESDEMNVRVYGDTAVVTSRGVSGGQYRGQAFREVERVSCVFVRQAGAWKCVLTHLSRIAGSGS